MATQSSEDHAPTNKPTASDSTATPEPKTFTIPFPANLPTPPFLHVEGIPNFRDLGGYPCRGSSSSDDGKITILRREILYRCAHPTHLTQKGAEYMVGKLGVRDMYDLRSAPEIARLATAIQSQGKDVYPLADPSTGALDSVPGLTRHFTPVYLEEDYGPVALARKLKWYTAASDTSDLGFSYSSGFVMAYRDIATHGASAYEKIFRHLLERPQEGLVFHCTAGKDRTGVFGALIMKLVGVEEEIICWEYALTEPGLGDWRKEFVERISKTGLGGGGAKAEESKDGEEKKKEEGEERPAVSVEEAKRICGSRAGNMRAWLRTVLEGEMGGVEAYLEKYCHLSKEEIEKLRGLLVEEVKRGDETKQVEIEGWTADGGCVD
jgi:hypothetical protein